MVEQIKAVCKEKEWSLAILEKKAGLKDRTVYRWDDNAPSVDKVVKAACALGVSVDYLCGLTEIKTPATESDGLTREELELIKIFRSVSPAARSAMLLLLRSAEAAQTVPGDGEVDR